MITGFLIASLSSTEFEQQLLNIVLSLQNYEIPIFAGISDLIDVAAEEKQKVVILRPLDKI